MVDPDLIPGTVYGSPSPVKSDPYLQRGISSEQHGIFPPLPPNQRKVLLKEEGCKTTQLLLFGAEASEIVRGMVMG